MPEKIYILTGPVQSGKTTKLMKWSIDKKEVSGILTPVVDGKRVFYNVRTKEQFRMEAEPGEENILEIGKFIFSKDSFERAIYILEKAMENNSGWLIIDEIGPLELRGEGFAEVMKNILDKGNSSRLLIVVRENLIQRVIDFFKINRDRAEVLKIDAVFFNK